MDPLGKVNAGGDWLPSASAHNAFVDAARFVQGLQHGQHATAPTIAPAGSSMLVKNSTGEDRDRYDAVCLKAGELFPPAADNLESLKNTGRVTAVAPTEHHRFGLWGVLLDPLKPDKIGRVLLVGVVLTKVRLHCVWHRFADLPTDLSAGSASNRYRLTSCDYGAAEILAADHSTLAVPPDENPHPNEIVWAMVRIGNPGLVFWHIKTKEDHPGRGTPFDAYLGQWEPLGSAPDFSQAETDDHTVKVIDWRYGASEPDANAQGTAIPLPSAVSGGSIGLIIDLDCDAPP